MILSVDDQVRLKTIDEERGAIEREIEAGTDKRERLLC